MTVAIVEVESDQPDENELVAAYREASDSAAALADEWSETSNEAWERLEDESVTHD